MTEQKSSPIHERRKAERFPIALDVFCRHSPKGKKIKATSSDLSGTGLSIISKQPLSTGISVGLMVSTQKHLKRGDTVEFSVGDQKKGIQFFSVRCKVMWTKKVGDKYQAGLAYMQIEKQDQFIEFICDKMMERYVKEE